jgi:fructose-bisphosphate aldolase/6-deoxy-5-ketofructose 1-phosphate synthase
MNKQNDLTTIPADVAPEFYQTYLNNYLVATKNSGRLMLVGGDHEGEYKQTNPDPEFMFRVAKKANIGVFSTLPEHLLYYGMNYKDLPYVVRLSNGDAVQTDNDQISNLVRFQKKNGVNIVGVRYKITFGKHDELKMIQEAAKAVKQAHQYGLLAIVWGEFERNSLQNTTQRHLLIRATKVATLVNADFLKVSYTKQTEEKDLTEAMQYAGRTKVVFAGGEMTETKTFLTTVHQQLHTFHASGTATGRNIENRSFDEAVRLCNAISAMTFDNISLQDAFALYQR